MPPLVTAILTAVVSFVLTGLIGNWLVQRWQQRNWTHQYHLQRAEREFFELRKIIDEIMILGDARNNRARWLIRNFGNPPGDIDRLRKEHADSVTQWMDKFTSLTVQLTVYAGFDRFTTELENDIQPRFVEIGEYINSLLKKKPGESYLLLTARIEEALNTQSGRLFRFSRDLTQLLIQRQKSLNAALPFTEETLHLFSTWYLLKALFKPLQSLEPVRGSTLDF